MIKLAYITEENGMYVVHAESGRVFGRYKDIKDAKKRLAQMEYFKHLKKTAARAPGLKNFFASEPMCKVHGAATHCEFGNAPQYTAPKGLGKKAALYKAAISPMLVRKVLSKATGALKTVGLEDYGRIQGKIDKMMGSTLKKSLMSGPKPSKADKVMVNVLKHESNRLGTKYQESFLKNLHKKNNDLKIGLN